MTDCMLDSTHKIMIRTHTAFKNDPYLVGIPSTTKTNTSESKKQFVVELWFSD